MKVWIVQYHDYDAEPIKGVFSTEEKAKAYFDTLNKDGQVNSTVEGYEVDGDEKHE